MGNCLSSFQKINIVDSFYDEMSKACHENNHDKAEILLRLLKVELDKNNISMSDFLNVKKHSKIAFSKWDNDHHTYVNKKDEKSILFVSAYYGASYIFNLLLENGAKIQDETEVNQCPIIFKICTKGNSEIYKSIMAEGKDIFDINYQFFNGEYCEDILSNACNKFNITRISNYDCIIIDLLSQDNIHVKQKHLDIYLRDKRNINNNIIKLFQKHLNISLEHIESKKDINIKEFMEANKIKYLNIPNQNIYISNKYNEIFQDTIFYKFVSDYNNHDINVQGNIYDFEYEYETFFEWKSSIVIEDNIIVTLIFKEIMIKDGYSYIKIKNGEYEDKIIISHETIFDDIKTICNKEMDTINKRLFFHNNILSRRKENIIDDEHFFNESNIIKLLSNEFNEDEILSIKNLYRINGSIFKDLIDHTENLNFLIHLGIYYTNTHLCNMIESVICPDKKYDENKIKYIIEWCSPLFTNDDYLTEIKIYDKCVRFGLNFSLWLFNRGFNIKRKEKEKLCYRVLIMDQPNYELFHFYVDKLKLIWNKEQFLKLFSKEEDILKFIEEQEEQKYAPYINIIELQNEKFD